MVRQNDREVVAATGKAVLHTNGTCYTFRANARSAWVGVGVERAKLAEFVADPEDLVARPFDSDSAAMRHLGRYLRLILGPDGIGDDETLNDHIGATLVDLVALALGTGRDAGELARLRGRRAALLREVVAEIKTGYADASFSTERVAKKLGLSPRTIQDLLHQSGRSFFERVMELRLQRARALLASPRCDSLKVIEIAHASGFNEVSYFNRCFRSRFGITPTYYRGNGAQ
jgi:AraC-like DNA-binding protein